MDPDSLLARLPTTIHLDAGHGLRNLVSPLFEQPAFAQHICRQGSELDDERVHLRAAGKMIAQDFDLFSRGLTDCFVLHGWRNRLLRLAGHLSLLEDTSEDEQQRCHVA